MLLIAGWSLSGPQYIEIAFRAAREADPHTLLTYNDYGVEYDSAEEEKRRFSILGLLRNLRARNVSVDAVGIQPHIRAAAKDSIGEGLQQFMPSVRDMELQLFLTELDISEDDITDNDVAVRDRIFAQTCSQFLGVALANKDVVEEHVSAMTIEPVGCHIPDKGKD